MNRSSSVQQYVKRGLISQADLEFLAELDPSPNQKYLPFIIKYYLANVDLDQLRNRISEYDALLNRSQVVIKDIHSFKTFQQLDLYVQELNNISSTRGLKRLIKKDAEIILDTNDIFIVRPQSHEASCLYGAGTKWCTTAKNHVHWERYFYDYLMTFYYIQVRSDEIKKKLPEDSWKLAVAVFPNGRMRVYDAADHHKTSDDGFMYPFVTLDNFFKPLGIDKSIFVPSGINERMDDLISYKTEEGTTKLDLSRTGITQIPDNIGNMTQLDRLILSENKIRILPESIGKLSNLKTLYLFHNELASLPESLGSMTGLQYLGLSGNTHIPKRIIRELKTKLPTTRIYMK
ncbi:MAG: leucine-rich repeat domain-containing protein [Bacteroidia bacterium]